MRILLIGFGVVGRSFVKLLRERSVDLAKEFGVKPKLLAVVDRYGAAVNTDGLDYDKVLSVKEKTGSVSNYPEFGKNEAVPLSVLEEVEVDLVVEATPTDVKTGEPGISHIRKAFQLGRHVITTNKGPLALAFPVLKELSEYNGVYFRFSGTVGGGLPILSFAKKCLKGDKIIGIRGVLNGTTNYILTKMDEDKLSFREALSEAQKLGLAEADPTLDVEGIDTATKLVILANWILGRKAVLSDVKVSGISKVTKEDLEVASRNKSVLRLVGSVDGELRVNVSTISRSDPLAVRNSLNAITLSSQFAGDETIVGKGAGGMETASSILRDLIDIRESLYLEQVK